MAQVKNQISWLEIKKLSIYLVRIIIIFGLIQAITAFLGLDLSNYISDTYQPLVVAILNWCLEWLNQYKKGIEKEVPYIDATYRDW